MDDVAPAPHTYMSPNQIIRLHSRTVMSPKTGPQPAIGAMMVPPLPMTTNSRQLVEGWQGRYYEDFEVGDVYKHPFGRTITETDDVWFTNVTMNTNPMHFNEVYAAETEFGERLVNGTFVFALAVGMSVIDVSANATANLGYDEIRHHAPVFHGDTIFAESEVVELRESSSRDHVGIVTTELRAFNQDDEKVLSLQRTPMVLKREFAEPTAEQPVGWPEGVGTQPEDVE